MVSRKTEAACHARSQAVAVVLAVAGTRAGRLLAGIDLSRALTAPRPAVHTVRSPQSAGPPVKTYAWLSCLTKNLTHSTSGLEWTRDNHKP